MTPANRLPGNKWRILLVIVLVLGVCFRFTNLDQKIYWEDETYTSLRAAGYTLKQGTDQLYTGKIIGIQDLQTYQRPSADTSAGDVIRVLAEDDGHPPLYFLLARLWSGWFGSSAAAMRALPACLSLLTLPLTYWFCLELFQTSIVGWFAVALVAVSPIFVRYAQESRQYSLWIVLILLSGILLLRAIRLNTKFNWFIYGLSLIAALYTHLFSCLWIAGQGLYVIVAEKFRLTKTSFSYGKVIVFTLLAFIPWLLLFIPHLNNFVFVSSWIKEPLPVSVLANSWTLNFSRAFISWDFHRDKLLIYLTIPIVVLVGYAILFLCRNTDRKTWLLLLSPAAATAVTLVLLDLVWGGRRSRNSQYFFPCYIAIQLAVAYLLASKFNHSSYFQRKFWRVAAALLLSAGVLSCAFNAQAETWWGWSEYEVKTCQIINQASQALVISDARLTQILPLSYKLEPEVRFMLFTKPDQLAQLPTQFSDLFVYNPSELLLAQLKRIQTAPVELIYQFRENSLVVSLYHIGPSSLL